jgi:hypothetical protein
MILLKKMETGSREIMGAMEEVVVLIRLGATHVLRRGRDRESLHRSNVRAIMSGRAQTQH